jgi:hypothetical protein
VQRLKIQNMPDCREAEAQPIYNGFVFDTPSGIVGLFAQVGGPHLRIRVFNRSAGSNPVQFSRFITITRSALFIDLGAFSLHASRRKGAPRWAFVRTPGEWEGQCWILGFYVVWAWEGASGAGRSGGLGGSRATP